MTKQTVNRPYLQDDGEAASFRQSGSFEPRPVQLNSLIEKTLSGFRRSLPASMNMTYVLHATPDSISADIGQLQQVIELLLQNAVEANERYGGEIFVTTSNTILSILRPNGQQSLRAQPYVVITIRDDSHGTDEHALRRMLDPSDTTHEPGRKLDLSTVGKVIKQHGGFIEVASTPERGTVVHLLLPEENVP